MNDYLSMTDTINDIGGEYEQIKDGEYEVEIESAEETEIPTTHTPKLKFVYTIRSDVEQGFQGRKIFEDWFKIKESHDYNKKRLRQIIGATKRAEPTQTFATLKEVLDFLVGKQVVVNVKNEDDSYNGKTRTRLNVKFYKESQHKPQTLNTQVDLTDDEMPF